MHTSDLGCRIQLARMYIALSVFDLDLVAWWDLAQPRRTTSKPSAAASAATTSHCRHTRSSAKVVAGIRDTEMEPIYVIMLRDLTVAYNPARHRLYPASIQQRRLLSFALRARTRRYRHVPRTPEVSYSMAVDQHMQHRQHRRIRVGYTLGQNTRTQYVLACLANTQIS